MICRCVKDILIISRKSEMLILVVILYRLFRFGETTRKEIFQCLGNGDVNECISIENNMLTITVHFFAYPSWNRYA